MGNLNLQLLLLYAIPILFAITLHEVAHGWVARKLGDDTADRAGRLTLNPIRHIDMLGTVIVPLLLFFTGGFIFGWARPVPVDWNKLNNPKRDMAWVALAGPGANLLMALLWGLIANLAFSLHASFPQAGFVFYNMGLAGVMVNIALMVLNLLPIPPLDGSRVVSSMLSDEAAASYNRLERWGFLILLALLLIPVGGVPLLWYIVGPVMHFFVGLIV